MKCEFCGGVWKCDCHAQCFEQRGHQIADLRRRLEALTRIKESFEDQVARIGQERRDAISERDATLEREQRLREALAEFANVYQMPEGDWGFACAGFVSDGYAAEHEAYRAAAACLMRNLEETHDAP